MRIMLIAYLPATKLPAQSICTFAETLHLLMQPEARHVQLNVDVKLDNDPEILFKLMHEQISQFPGWETDLAPRLILGGLHELDCNAKKVGADVTLIPRPLARQVH